MEKRYILFIVIIVFLFAACSFDLSPFLPDSQRNVSAYSFADRDLAVAVEAVENDSRKNASGPKITSNAHSDDFPGILFIWDAGQKDAGYLKVDASLFDKLEYFVLTAKQGNIYWDFKISVRTDQQMTLDGFYIYFIPKVAERKNINMVFIGEVKAKIISDEPIDPEDPIEPEDTVPPKPPIIGINGIEMVWVPAGSFMMGNSDGYIHGYDYKRYIWPQHEVTLSGFYMGKYEVTQEEYLAVMGVNPSYYSTANNRPPIAGEKAERRPVERVNWYSAISFCNKLSVLEGLTPSYRLFGSTNPDDWGPMPTYLTDPLKDKWDTIEIVSGSNGYRLPTEAQWEYAAKGGDGSPGDFIYSGSNDANLVGWVDYINNNHQVGLKKPNGLGIYDLTGNVLEWCWDRWDYYTSEAKTDPTGPRSTISLDRVQRGGSFNGLPGWNVYRSFGNCPAYNGIGFRVVRPGEPSENSQ